MGFAMISRSFFVYNFKQGLEEIKHVWLGLAQKEEPLNQVTHVDFQSFAFSKSSA